MSADLLREAAALMRKQAKRMPPGRYGMWSRWTTPTTMLSRVTQRGRVIAEVRDGGQGCYTVDYFASWHPLVALAVADWLELEADCELPPDYDPAGDLGMRRALAVARAYLGRDA